MGQLLTLINDPMLTNREIEILEYVTLGLSAKEVARHIDISPRTVDRHVESARLKLRARNRTHMVACAVKAGLLTVNSNDDRGIFRMSSDDGLATIES
ncbi:response regulator transcription factor [Parasphingorhabdus cellanae]|uniref:Helix-turn-helix transcriptional regulator n=1 Tax=Parasphingorhabdus cellanae TaxID=2806553 RepID=A0ABX7T540_9SPHN|nr:helix-turn-helix transcriptional regulator [Parasphingorhabdus cellanae]QTD55227.1 helix-turn-helix transcriptional regulator [Parasphingorhabdus cellanae]